MKKTFLTLMIVLLTFMMYGQEHLTNNEFDDDFATDGWGNWAPSVIDFTMDTNGELENANSGLLDVISTGYFQLGHYVELLAGHTYQFNNISKSNNATGIFLQLTIPGVLPGGTAFMTSWNSTPTAEYTNTSFVVDADANVNLYLEANVTSGDKIWIDGIHLVDLGVLPVAWKNHPTADIRNEKSYISWSVASQINNEKFIIEHSTDGTLFNAIGELHGEKNASVEMKYHYTHNSPSKGMNYYRIQQVDYDGKTTYSNVTSAKKYASSISNYPNPVVDYYYFNSDRNTLLTIYNAEGRLIEKISINEGQNIIDMSEYSTGMYLLKTNTNTVESVIKR